VPARVCAIVSACRAFGCSPSPPPLHAARRSGIRRHTGEEVEVLSGSAPSRPHVDVAILVAHRGDDSFEQALAKVKADAGALGCDAIVIDKVARSARDIAPDELTATCVMYKT
jgi:hypothetical protein